MTSLPEQFSAARNAQSEAQFSLLQNITTKAFDRAEQVLALNMSATRATIEQSSNAIRQLAGMRDARDLLALGTQTQQHFSNLVSYSQELLSITSGARLQAMARTTVAAPEGAAARALSAPAGVPAPAPQTVAFVEVVATEAAAAAATVSDQAGAAAEPVLAAVTPTAAAPDLPGADASARSQPAAMASAAENAATPAVARSVKPGKKPVVLTAQPSALSPIGKATAIADAAGELAAGAAGVPKPLASTLATAGSGPVVIPPIKPVEAAPPPAPSSGTPQIDVQLNQAASAKPSRKK
jgi:hypothetical protein